MLPPIFDAYSQIKISDSSSTISARSHHICRLFSPCDFKMPTQVKRLQGAFLGGKKKVQCNRRPANAMATIGDDKRGAMKRLRYNRKIAKHFNPPFNETSEQSCRWQPSVHAVEGMAQCGR